MKTFDILSGKILVAVLPIVLGSLLGISTSPVWAQEPAANRQMLCRNGFEAGEEGLSPWWQNGGYTVNFAGHSEERAFKGKSSFKLDITFTTGTSCYWRGTRLSIPKKGSPTLRCALYVEKGKAQIGYGYNGGASGMCGSALQVRQDPSGWTEWEADIKPSLVDMEHLEHLAVYINGACGERVVIFVDEFEVEGTPFPALAEKIKRQVQSEADAAKKRSQAAFQSRLNETRGQLQEVEELQSKSPPPLPGMTASWLRKIDERLSAYCEDSFLSLEKKLEGLAGKSDGTWQQCVPIQDQLRYLRYGLVSYHNLPDFVKTYGDRPYLVYVVPPIRNDKVLPDSFPVPGAIGTELSLAVCPDEYRPVSFALYAAKELKEVKVVASALASSSLFRSRHPSPRVDLFLVKCWWQAGINLNNCDPDHPVLTPELLLKDPGLVEVDNIKKRNKLKNPSAPQDAKTLQPVTIPEGTLQQYWITVYVPKETPAGVYKGILKVEMNGAPGITLPLSVDVLPFQLEPPVLEYGIYYEDFLFDASYSPNSPNPHFDSLIKTEQQYLADMMDLKAHGIELPVCEDDILVKDGSLDFSHFRRIWELRKKAVLTRGPIVKGRSGVPISQYASEKDPVKKKELLKTIRERTKQWMAFCKETGFPTPLIYGIDEAEGDVLGAERDAFKAVQEAGGMTAAAVGGGGVFFRYAGDSLNRPIIQGGTTPEELRMIHDLGYKAWIYANPQGGMEEPETYRRNYGLGLWQRGYDGACTWAYQWATGKSMWDDFDAGYAARDFMMTYPAIDGPIATIQWEGWREGYNDVRYLSTLLKLIEAAKTKAKTRSLALEDERWLNEVKLEGDLDVVRKEMVKRILQLRELDSP